MISNLWNKLIGHFMLMRDYGNYCRNRRWIWISITHRKKCKTVKIFFCVIDALAKQISDLAAVTLKKSDKTKQTNQKKKLNSNVGKLEYNDECNTAIELPQQSYSRKKLKKPLLSVWFFLVSLAGNTVIGVTVYKTKSLRKPINFFIVNMAMSDLLFTIFFIPREIQLF